MTRQFFKYVLQSMAGMIGVSIYILADTYYISVQAGADGLAVLNLVLPVYGLIFAIGSMISVGSATRFTIEKAHGKQVDFYFTQSLSWCVLAGIPFSLLGIMAPELVLRIMGADQILLELGRNYTRIFLTAAPFFMMNYTFNAFVRNDHAPMIAMLAAICGSMFNIVFDYILMFPMGLGLEGAALATSISPVVSMLVCMTHFLSKKNQVGFQWRCPSVKHIISCCQLGVPAFVGEIAAAVTTITFNMLILGIAGNIGVAAYGVIANIALVVTAMFNGISQGIQPLISDNFGHGNQKNVNEILKLGIVTSLVIMGIVLLCTWGATDALIAIFNHENNQELFAYAYYGMRIYFLGFLFASVNIILVTYFAATGRVRPAFIGSISRGVAAIVICAVVLSRLFGMTGIWLSFLASEIITFALIFCLSRREG